MTRFSGNETWVSDASALLLAADKVPASLWTISVCASHLSAAPSGFSETPIDLAQKWLGVILKVADVSVLEIFISSAAALLSLSFVYASK